MTVQIADLVITNHNQRVRADFWSQLERLIHESNAPLEIRDNSNQEATRILFQKDGRSEFDHQVWRETKMLPEMIRLHQQRFLELNPHEQREFKEKSNCALSFDEQVKYEQEVDDNGLSEQELHEMERLIAPIYSRQQLEAWAAKIFLKRDDSVHQKREDDNTKSQSENNNPKLNYNDLMNNAVVVDGMSKKSAAKAKASANKAIHRAIEKNRDTDLPFKIQNCGNLDQYLIITPKRQRYGNNGEQEKVSPLNCEYQKIIEA